jgi:hypothetical protein
LGEGKSPLWLEIWELLIWQWTIPIMDELW